MDSLNNPNYATQINQMLVKAIIFLKAEQKTNQESQNN